jgi:hypothetical protein
VANFVRSTRSRRSRHVRFAPIASEPSHRSDSTRCADIVVKVPHKIGHLCCARPTPQGAGAEAFLRSFKEPPFFPAVASTAALATGSPDAELLRLGEYLDRVIADYHAQQLEDRAEREPFEAKVELVTGIARRNANLVWRTMRLLRIQETA